MCTSPVSVRVDGLVRLFPCGHCYECSNARSMDLAKALQVDSHSYKYKSFCLLSYSNEKLPLCSYSAYRGNDFSVSITPITNRINPEQRKIYQDGIVHMFSKSYHLSVKAFEDAKEVKSGRKMYAPNTFPVLNFPDVQQFMRSLRHFLYSNYIRMCYSMSYKSFIKKYGKKSLSHYVPRFRYYIVGEYSPRNFRPHYHVLLYHNCKQYASIMSDGVRSCWPYGIATHKFASGFGCEKYISEYITSSSSLPPLLRSVMPSKTIHSSRMGIDMPFASFEDICEYVIQSSTIGFRVGENYLAPVSLSGNLARRLLPRISGYSKVDPLLYRYLLSSCLDCAIIARTTKVSEIVRYFLEHETELPEYIRSYPFFKDEKSFESAFRRYLYIGKYYYKLSRKYNITLEYIEKMVRGVYSTLGLSKLVGWYRKMLDDIPDNIHTYNLSLYERALIRSLRYADFQQLSPSYIQILDDDIPYSSAIGVEQMNLLKRYYDSDEFLHEKSFRDFLCDILKYSKEITNKRLKSSRELYLSRVKHREFNEKCDSIFSIY